MKKINNYLQTGFHNFHQQISHVVPMLDQPLDRVAITLIIGLTGFMVVVLSVGDRTVPQVRDFSWQNQRVGVNDTAFIMTFNRPMNHASVEKNLQIEPALPGKVSWAGKRMAYTLLQPAPYGNTYTVQLRDAKEKYYGRSQGKIIKPFLANFQTRDRAFVYIGQMGEEEGRLMLFNFNKKAEKSIPLTPPNLLVMNFQPYPQGDKILFSAINQENLSKNLTDQELFSVTTGLSASGENNSNNSDEVPEAGKISQILDTKTYQNLKFALSNDGKIIVVQRVNRSDPEDFGPWVIEDGKAPRYLTNQEGVIQRGGDFLIAPDSKTLVMLRGEGTAIVPLNPETQQDDLMFLPKFGRVLSFTNDGSFATMMKFNQDGTRSLFVVSNQGQEKEVLRTRPYGNVLQAIFAPDKQNIYLLLTQVLENQEKYEEKPYIATLNWQKEQLTPLVILPAQQKINMSLSPDGLELLFDQTLSQQTEQNSSMSPSLSSPQNTIWWLLLIPEIKPDGSTAPFQPEKLPFTGINPQWIP
jgi:hypothetical protein